MRSLTREHHQEDFNVLIESLPVYTSKGRIGDAVECLRTVASECQEIRERGHTSTGELSTIVSSLHGGAQSESCIHYGLHIRRLLWHEELQTVEASASREPQRVHVGGKCRSACQAATKDTNIFIRIVPTRRLRLRRTEIGLFAMCVKCHIYQRAATRIWRARARARRRATT